MPFFSSIVVIVALVTLRKISNSASLIARLAWFLDLSQPVPDPLDRLAHIGGAAGVT